MVGLDRVRKDSLSHLIVESDSNILLTRLLTIVRLTKLFFLLFDVFKRSFDEIGKFKLFTFDVNVRYVLNWLTNFSLFAYSWNRIF